MTVGSDTLTFTYDASGRPLSVSLGGSTYYYVTNLQGDVTAILNTSGTAVVTYTYDAWGNPLTTSGDLATTLGTLNPLRYRGYVYDTETELYYLQSRYYDPQIGRFLNGDAYASTGQGILGNNMFAYCNNNPIVFSDSSGMIARVSLSAQTRIDEDPWREISLGTGGYSRRYDRYTYTSQARIDSSWLDTDWPTFLSLTNEGFELVSWGLSIYNCDYYFDNTEEQSFNFSAGNISAYAGAHSENGIGFNAGGNLISVGYDGVLIDFSLDFITAEAMYMYNNGKISGRVGFGWAGFGYAIDLYAIYENWFGGKERGN